MEIKEVQPLFSRGLLAGGRERRIWRELGGGFQPVNRESDPQNSLNLEMHVREGTTGCTWQG